MGERNGRAHLCESEVREIFALLRAGTHTQIEIARMYGIGRYAVYCINFALSWRRLAPQNWRPSSYAGPLRGSRSPLSVLTEEQAAEIKRLAREGVSPKQIAALFQISESTVFDIRSGRSWKHLHRNGNNAASAA